jgi:arsenite-transporting ATPase
MLQPGARIDCREPDVLLEGMDGNLFERGSESLPEHVFVTGKGGVGKTSVACALAVSLCDRGRRVLLVSTDPASNLSEVLETRLGPRPRAVAGVIGLDAVDLDPQAAALEYRERVVGPYRGILPEAAVRSIEEQLSGACTVEIATFDEFAKLLGDASATTAWDTVIYDTAPTGHTLRLLELPSAWSGFLSTNAGGTSCLGPLAGLSDRRTLYERARETLVDASRTALVLVARPDRSALDEAERARSELEALGIVRAELVLNGIFTARDRSDPVALSLEARGKRALAHMPRALAKLRRSVLPLLATELSGIAALRELASAVVSGGPSSEAAERASTAAAASVPPPEYASGALARDASSTVEFRALVDSIAASGHGVVLTMGKGGVGKTTVAAAVAIELSRRGFPVHLTTTDPAARDGSTIGDTRAGFRQSRIDPEVETRAWSTEVLTRAGSGLDDGARALLEEDLRSPCTEEIAVFRAFARVVDEADTGFVVVDTAPTGHTLLLLDAAEAYHREVERASGNAPEEIRRLLPRLRDAEATKILLVTLPEATPVHEAAALERDLERAGIHVHAWVINQSLTPLSVSDPILRERQRSERRYIEEIHTLASRTAILPWLDEIAAPSVPAGTP